MNSDLSCFNDCEFQKKKVMNLFVVGGQPKKKKQNTSQLKRNKIHQTHFLNLWLLLVIQFYSPLSTDKVVFDNIFFNLCGIHWKNYHHSPWCWWEWWIIIYLAILQLGQYPPLFTFTSVDNNYCLFLHWKITGQPSSIPSSLWMTTICLYMGQTIFL